MALDPTISLAVRTPQVENPLDTAGKALSIVGAKQQQQAADLGIQQQQMSLDQTKALNDAYRDAVTVGPNGAEIDTGKLTNALGQGGHGSAIPTVLKGVNDFQKSTAELSELRGKLASQEQDYAGIVGATTKAANYDPNIFLVQAQHAVNAKAVDPNAVMPLIQHVQQSMQADPTGAQARAMVQQISDQFIAGSPAQQKLINEGKTATSAEQRGNAALATSQREAELQPAKLSEQQAKASQAQRQNDATLIAAAAQHSPEALAAAVAALPPDRASAFNGVNAQTKPEDILRIGMTPDQQVTTGQAATNAAELRRHNLSEESISKINSGISGGRLAQEQMVNGIKYGPGNVEYWVKQLQDNPDSVKEMPPEFRSNVGKQFRDATGLPLPTPLTGQSQTQETAARNALDNIAFIRKAIQNPEISKQLGPLLGRLGDVEQHIGTAVGLSPEAEALGQELRTRMRYFNLQEGKALLGRPNAALMQTLAGSSPNPKMDSGILEGAMKGAEGSATDILDNADKQRFGGKMRSHEMRGITTGPALPQGAGKTIDKGTAQQFYDAAGKDPAKAKALAEKNGWIVQ